MPMTNKEWIDIKMEEAIEAEPNVGEDYVEALTRLKEEIEDKDKVKNELQRMKEIFAWAEKEICDITRLYKKFNKIVD